MKRSVPKNTTVLGHISVTHFHRLLGAGPSSYGWGQAVPGTITAIWRIASRATHARFLPGHSRAPKSELRKSTRKLVEFQIALGSEYLVQYRKRK